MTTLASTPVVSQFPHLKEVPWSFQDSQWKLFYYEEFEKLMIQDHHLEDSVLKWCQEQAFGVEKPIRFQSYLKSIPFLVGVFPQEKEVRLYTPRLNLELTLLQMDESSKEFEALKNHVSKVAQLRPKDFPSISKLITKKENLPDFWDARYKKVELESEAAVKELLRFMNEYKSTLFEKVTDYGLGLTAAFALIRIHLLKFVAMLPSLDHDKSGTEVRRMLIETLKRLIEDSKSAAFKNKKGQERPLPYWMILVCKTTKIWATLFPAQIVSFVVRVSVRAMARRFIAGETIELATESLKSLYETGRDVTLDQLGELVVSERESDKYCDEVLKLIRGFSLHVPRGAKNKAGINRAHVSIKVSALSNDFKSYAFDYTYEQVAPRLKKILMAACEEDVFLNIDAEHYDYRDIVFRIYKKVLLETPELQQYQQTGIVVQAYLRDAHKHLIEIIDLAKDRKMTMPVRLVKGAYWDAETVHAEAHSFDPPEFFNKEETDIMFRQIIVKTFDAWPHIQLAMASHNYSDHCFASTLRKLYYPSIPAIEHQCLHMTYEALSVAMNKMGWAVRNYIPVGSLLVGMAYLVRRIMENSSQVGVLTIMRSHKKKVKLLTPEDVHEDRFKRGDLLRDYSQVKLSEEFINVPPVKMFVENQRLCVEGDLNHFRNNHFGKLYPNAFDLHGEIKDVISSSDPSLVVGKIQYATKEDVTHAIDLAHEAYNEGSWAKASFQTRATYLLKAANLMLTERNPLSSLIVYEAGKTINEALADVDEAIDFLNYYAREEMRLGKESPELISRGVVGVIAPWNFPLAIACGMTAGALVAGNAVLLKSARQTPLVAQRLIDLIHEAGVPKNLLIHVPGPGDIIGDSLSESPKVAHVIFTGSKAVGMMLAHKVSRRLYKNSLFNTTYPARATTEMGGKNAIIVTANAELDETVSGILYSAFGHSGQKCSAASRVIVDNRIKSRLLERLKEAAFDQEVSESFKFSCSLNPLISKGEKVRLQESVALAVKEATQYGGKVWVDRTQEDLPGFCVGPAVIELPIGRAFHSESFAQKELFGPVIHVIGFDHPEEAIKLFNSTEYALTGGVFGQSQDDLDYFTSKMEVGNIYVNRPITGARVKIEPFGGFKLSGTGPKAGGKTYIRHFHVLPEKETISENVEWGSHSFEETMPSKLSAQSRQRRCLSLLESLTVEYEAIFKDMKSERKEMIKLWSQWVRNSYLDYALGKDPNRTIPGQISYNSYALSGECGLLIVDSKIPSSSILASLFGALLSGVGLSVVCRNKDAFEWWSNFKFVVFNAGFSRDNFKVTDPTQESFFKEALTPELSFVLVDSDTSKISELLAQIFSKECTEIRMRKIISPLDNFGLTDFYGHCEQFSWARSFAVNTMRYGAPLELEDGSL